MIKKAFLFLLAITASLSLMSDSVQAGVNDFVITDYKIDFRLGRDAEKRSTLDVKETITAEFPQFDQNHGIERAIPERYDGHSVNLEVISVTDTSGRAWNYKIREDNDMKVIRIGDADKYVHGLQTFVITYKQRDVTRYFENTKSDEFYWDTNGTGWNVPINRLSVSLTLEDGLEARLTGNEACYQGAYGIKRKRELKHEGGVFMVNGENLKEGENITIAVGFKPGTFEGYKMSLFEKLFYGWLLLQAGLTVLAVILLIWIGTRYYRWSNRVSEQNPIAPEYLPPKDASVSMAAILLGVQTGFAAQLVDLAVRHYIKIYETEKPGLLFGKKKDYELEIIKDTDDLSSEEREIISDIFKPATVGSRISMAALKADPYTPMRISDNTSKFAKLAKNNYALRNKVPEKTRWFQKFSLVSIILAVLLLSPAFLVLSIIAIVMSFTLTPLTDKGLALIRHIKGLKMYIKVAEQERLRMLQSPEGAAKVAVDTKDGTQIVKLYERVLPYAILFGLEKQWNKQLGQYYESTGRQPDWYTGTNLAAFNAASFSSAISSFSSSASSSSSSGGSSGGGSSGGGGGGGGGGGW